MRKKIGKEDLTTVEGIRAALLATAPREPTDKEDEGLDGLDRQEYFCEGYRVALAEFAARLVAK